MHRLAVDQHGAGAAVAGVAALLDAEMAELAQERAQALAGVAAVLRKLLAVDLEAHAYAVPCNSTRISSASRSVMCLRQNGLPWTSVVVESRRQWRCTIVSRSSSADRAFRAKDN